MTDRPRVVINAGGSIIAPDVIDPSFIAAMAALLGRTAVERDLLVVVGGGRTARRYIEACRDLGADEDYLDRVGIEATRLNARLLVAALSGRAFPDVPPTVDDALAAARSHTVVVMGGTVPGQTTDTVSAELAESGGAEELLILTNVNGVYTSDPRRDPGAERLERITTSQLVDIVSGGTYKAGSTAVVDPVAAGIIHRGRIPTKVLDGRDLEQVSAALAGGEFDGTVVTPDGR